MNGLCRRCRQPGHIARDCRRAWSGSGTRASRVPVVSDPPPVADSVPSGEVSASAGVVRDVEMDSGDEEVIAGAAEAAAAAASSSRPAPGRRRRRRRRSRKNCDAVPFPRPGTVGYHRPADLSPLGMDLSSVDKRGGVSYLSSFKEIWTDTLTWEELRSVKFGHVLKRFGDRVYSVAAVPTLLFGSKLIGAAPVEYQTFGYE